MTRWAGRFGGCSVGHFRERVGGLLASESGARRDLPVLREPVLGGPRWWYEDAGLGGDGDRGARALACVEQIRRSLAVGGWCAAVTWAQRLTVLLMVNGGGDPLWSPRHG